MSMTMTQKILAAHADSAEVHAGQLISCKLDFCFGNDITTPVAIDTLTANGLERVAEPDKVAIILDHFTPNKDIHAATLCQQCRGFAKKHGITKLYDTGRAGIEHALIPEQGLVTAGDLVIGADSHTCTYGALGAFSTGVGSTDFAAGMCSGNAWFRVPQAISIQLTGKLQPYVTGKDVILTLLGILGADAARYASLEFSGEGVQHLSMDDRFTICNMAIEAGAKNGIFPVDAQTIAYLEAHGAKSPRIFAADDAAPYIQTIFLDLSQVSQTVAVPPSPQTVCPVRDTDVSHIDEVLIGSCTNGRLSDLRAAAEVFRGNHVAENVRCIVLPATQQIFLDAMHEGLIDIFIEAGCAVSTPTCGACLGGHMGVLAPHEIAVSTTNRNFIGRMGHPTAQIYLASPYVAAASAVAGRLAAFDGRCGK